MTRLLLRYSHKTPADYEDDHAWLQEPQQQFEWLGERGAPASQYEAGVFHREGFKVKGGDGLVWCVSTLCLSQRDGRSNNNKPLACPVDCGSYRLVCVFACVAHSGSSGLATLRLCACRLLTTRVTLGRCNSHTLNSIN